MSGLRKQLARVATIWVLLSAGLVHAQDHPSSLSQNTKSTSSAMTTEGAVSKGATCSSAVDIFRNAMLPALKPNLVG